MMQEIESMFTGVKAFTLDTPDWNIRTNSFYIIQNWDIRK